MPNVIFRYEDGTATKVAVTAGENLLEVARKANVAIDAPCSGNGSCGKCRVKFISGELDSVQTRPSYYGRRLCRRMETFLLQQGDRRRGGAGTGHCICL